MLRSCERAQPWRRLAAIGRMESRNCPRATCSASKPGVLPAAAAASTLPAPSAAPGNDLLQMHLRRS